MEEMEDVGIIEQIRFWDYYQALQHKFWSKEMATVCLSGANEESNELNMLLKYKATYSKLEASGLYDLVGSDPTQQEVIQWAKEFRHYFTPDFKEAMKLFYYEFVDDYLLMDTWNLKEAVCLIRGIDPSVPILAREKLDEFAKYLKIAQRSIDSGKLLVLKPKQTTNENHEKALVKQVSPEQFLKWALLKNCIIPLKLIDAAKEISNSHLIPEVVKNPEVIKFDKPKKEKHMNQYKRESILGAALCAVANFPERCKTKGRFVGAKIVECIEVEEELKIMVTDEKKKFFREPDGMANLINACLKLETLSRGKKNLQEIFDIDTKKKK